MCPFLFQPRTKKSLQLKYKNLKKYVKDKAAAHKRSVMGTGGGQGPGELTFKHPIFMELYEAIKLSVDGHAPRFDDDESEVGSQQPQHSELNESQQINSNNNSTATTGNAIEQLIAVDDLIEEEYLIDNDNSDFEGFGSPVPSTSAVIVPSPPTAEAPKVEPTVEDSDTKPLWQKYSAAMLKKRKSSALNAKSSTQKRKRPNESMNDDANKFNFIQAKMEMIRKETEQSARQHELDMAHKTEEHDMRMAKHTMRIEQETAEHVLRMAILRAQLSNAQRPAPNNPNYGRINRRRRSSSTTSTNDSRWDHEVRSDVDEAPMGDINPDVEVSNVMPQPLGANNVQHPKEE